MHVYYNLIITLLAIITVNVILASRLQQPDDFQSNAVYQDIQLTMKPIGSTSFDVEWKLFPDVNTSVYYLLTYSSQVTNDVKFTSSNNLTLTELMECTLYTITVRCSHRNDENAFSPFSSTTALTSHNFQLKTVKNLTVETSSHSVLIAWENPDEQNLCTANYHVSLTAVRGIGKESQTKFNHYLMTALEPCVAYYGYVSAVDFSGTHGNPMPFNVTTDSAIPGPVLKLSAISNYSKSIIVSWDKPIDSSSCVHQYAIVYCNDMFTCSSVTTQVNYLNILQLKPCVKYQITVTPIIENNVSGSSANTEATVIAEVLEKPLNGRVLLLTNFTAILQWDPPIDSVCNLIHQIVNCSYLNSSFQVITYKPDRVVLNNLKPSTEYICYSAFFNKEGYSAKSDKIIFRTKLTVPDPPTNLSIIKISASRVVLAWAPPTMILPGEINGYRWTVTFKNFLYELPKYCQAQTEDVMTYFIKNDQTYQYQIINLRPASYYVIGLSASTESGFGNATNITVHTLSSTSSPVENLNVISIQSNSIVLSWKYPCVPNGKVAFFHSTLVGERVGYHNHIFSIKFDISENETEFEYTITNLMAEYKYICSIVAITYTVEIPGQDKRIQFITPSTSPTIPAIYETFRRLQVTVSENHLTQVRVTIPHDLFSSVNGNIQYYSIIVYQDGGFPDKPERYNRNVQGEWPPVMRTWAEAAPYPFILAYQTTPDRWMPFKNREDTIYNIGADKNCPKNVEKMYCNGPLRPVTNYRLKLRAFTTNGLQDSWTVPFTTPGESTAVYYLVLCSVIFAVIITATGLHCILNEKFPWAVKYRAIHSMESDVPGDMNFKQLLAKTPREIEAEYNLLNRYLDSNFSADVAVMPQNKFKNRYVNTLPYDYNRVTINSSDNGYINASFIEDFNGIRQYIACQGPMKNTCIDMWKMILDYDVASIVMLCQTTENDKIKCEKYFPNGKEKLVFGDIQVRNDIMIVDKEHPFITRILTVLKGDLKKTIRHFQFLDWPDFGTPSNPSVLVKFCQVVHAKSPAGLIVVHCSAGVGRTGTYIACDILLRLIRNKSKLNIFKTVLKLREQRTNMVQSQVQYDFIYKFVSYVLKQYIPLDI